MLNPTDPARNNEAHLRRAHEIAGTPSLNVFLQHLENGEFKHAAEALSKYGDERGNLSREFWLALWYVYDNLGLNDDATRCQFRMTEAKH